MSMRGLQIYSRLYSDNLFAYIPSFTKLLGFKLFAVFFVYAFS